VKLLRKLLILSHRYLGIALCLLVAMWFATGIVMMYAGGMPRLDPDLRLARMPDLDLSKVRLTLADASNFASKRSLSSSRRPVLCRFYGASGEDYIHRRGCKPSDGAPHATAA
jgi:hypothetical protein